MNKIAMMLALTAGITCVAFGYEPQRHNDTFTTNGVTYAQRGGLGADDYVVTNIDASAVGKVQSVNGKTGEVSLNASDVGALPLVEDANSNKTAVTIGSRTGDVGPNSLANGGSVVASGNNSHAEGFLTTASGINSHAEGFHTTASGNNSHAEGFRTTASADGSHAEGHYAYTKKQDHFAFAWNGDESMMTPYESHGVGTFNINPYGGMDGFYIGEQTLASILTNKADKDDISATNTTFSNAVLAVGLNIDTNSVAVLNEIASTFGGFPLGAGETATTVGGLLAALAAAVAWLKKNKADKEDVLPRYYFANLEVVDGVVTVPPYTNAGMLSDGTAFTVAVGGEGYYMRDCILFVMCGGVAPTITWPANFHPRTDAETDFACVAGAMNVYWISEYVQGEFVVAGWQATAGGNAA